jgi:ATP-dependent protease ClpP protease subunit
MPPYVGNVNSPQSFFLTEFSSSVVKAFNSKIHQAFELGQELFPIQIESSGGDASSLHSFLSIMSSARKKGMKFATITTGESSSAGAFVFCFGDAGLRFIGEYARIMIHGLQVSGSVDGRVSEHNKLITEILKEEQELLQVVSQHLKGKRNKDFLRKELHKRKDIDWYLDAQESVELGIANHIGIPTFSLKLIPEISVSL